MTAAAGVIAAVDSMAAGVVLASALGTAFKALAAALGGLAILWLGILMLRVLSQPQPEPPASGRVAQGADHLPLQLVRDRGADDDRAPWRTRTPRHCGEEMSVMAPIEE